MFPGLLDAIGWSSNHCFDDGTNILLGDSSPIDAGPFYLSFVNYWLKRGLDTAVVFIAFRSSQARISEAYRRAFGQQLGPLTAQGRFSFVDTLKHASSAEGVVCDVQSSLSRGNYRYLIVVESYSACLSLNWSLGDFIKFHESIRGMKYEACLWHWSRDMEPDYPPNRSKYLKEDVTLGGTGWLHLMAHAHYFFCLRALQTGMSKEVHGEVVVGRGPWAFTECPIKSFFPLTSLYNFGSDNAILLHK